jgi:hypothetical protein
VSALTYDAETVWRFTSRQSGVEKVGTLRLWWEVESDPITDDFLPEETGPRELWDAWIRGVRERERYHHALGAPWVPIGWFVAGEDSATFEGAPFVEDMYPDLATRPREDFLTYFTPPEDANTGEQINWLRLPVAEKLWRPGQGDKGGFITEVSGWKPSPLQSAVDLRIFEAAGLQIT